MRLSDREFLEVIDRTPLVSIDLIISNAKNEILMGLRTNQPAKGYWFVPGGRIYKGETIARAFGRITLKELNKQVNFSKASLLDAYDHIYETNVFEEENISTHYVVLAYGVEEEDLQIENIINAHDDQHNEFRWISVEQAKLLKVHDNSRAYFSHIEKR